MRKFNFKHFTFRTSKILFVALFVLFCQYVVAASILTQSTVTLKMSNSSVKSVLLEIQKQTSINFIYKSEDLKTLGDVTISELNASVENILSRIFKNTDFKYELNGNDITITKNRQQPTQQPVKLNIKGKVLDENKKPVVGAVVIVGSSSKGAVTDQQGQFIINGVNSGEVLNISFVGMKENSYTLKPDSKDIIINMVAEEVKINDVVVTGIFTRKQESFSGSYASFTAKDLKSVGNSNILQSLKTLDPSFAVLENNDWGSDPNRLPDIQINGKSSMLGIRDQYTTDPNQPLFIVDGFEATLSTIYNMDMSRVESITLLKDAASTAIYGTKAANGVVVIETVKPKAGELRVSYTGNVNLSIPDLSSYNLMDAREKLSFEQLAGRYKIGVMDEEKTEDILQQAYNKNLRNISEGVDTYWLSQPLRTGVNHRHSVYVEGGEDSYAFLAGGSYNGITGVMKKSERESITGNLDFVYRTSKLRFTNKLAVTYTTNSDPTVSFGDYASANPYHKMVGESGEIERFLVNNDLYRESNPLYNDLLNSRIKGKDYNISNSFIAEYSPTNEFRLRARFGLVKGIVEKESFVSPEETRYEKKSVLDRGDYSYLNNSNFKYEGQLTATYAKIFNEVHQVNFVAGGELSSSNSTDQGHEAHGFPVGDFTYPSFSKGYPENGVPTYYNSQSRLVSLFANGGYSYDNRYLIDVSYRLNGSSLFGASKRYANTWSVGMAWNLHNEKFIKENLQGVNLFKIRGSIGNPSNLGFDSYMTLTTFKYDYNTFNYLGMSSYLNQIGNPDLRWQTTMHKSLGLDLTILKNRVSLTADYYHKNTDPLLVTIGLPSSAGSDKVVSNMGSQISQGFTASLTGFLIYRPADRFTWSLRGNVRIEQTKMWNIGNKLDGFNKYGRDNGTLVRYYDGADPDDIWAVQSLGIDPSTGRELFLKKDGSRTFDYAIEDEVVVGNIRPKAEGIIGTSFKYKGFSADINFRYRIGADVLNNALYNKAENINSTTLVYNQDKRALYDRWQKPGDYSQFKNIAFTFKSPISSRFVQKENTFALESLRVGYEFSPEMIKKIGLNALKLDAYMNEMFRVSTIRTERGISYPFARSIQFALTLTF